MAVRHADHNVQSVHLHFAALIICITAIFESMGDEARAEWFPVLRTLIDTRWTLPPPDNPGPLRVDRGARSLVPVNIGIGHWYILCVTFLF